MNQFNMSNMEIEEFCEALVLDYIRKYNAPTDYIDIRGLITDYLGLEIFAINDSLSKAADIGQAEKIFLKIFRFFSEICDSEK